jgi:hypothetical protein
MTALDDLDNFFKKVDELFPEEDTYAKQHSPEQSYETRLNPITIIINDIPFQAIEASLTREFEDSPLTHTGFRCQGTIATTINITTSSEILDNFFNDLQGRGF